jgi:hypothetical protein
VAERLGHTVDWAITGDDTASEENQVILSESFRDPSGFAAPRVLYRIADNTKRMFEWQVERAKESFEAAGASKVEAMPLVPVGTHLYGTARMGDDPEKSVVNRWGISHDIPNLAIVDGSVFVTTGGINPTSSIAALSLRTAEYIATHSAQLPRPARSTTIAETGPGRAQSCATPDNGEPAQAPPAFEPAEREQLAALADVLIPPGSGMPAPSEVGIGEHLLDQVLAARPDLVGALHRALQAGNSEGAERLSELAASDAEARDALELAVAGGYYMSAEVRSLIGYPGDEPVPVRPDPYPPYIEEGLLDHLIGK